MPSRKRTFEEAVEPEEDKSEIQNGPPSLLLRIRNMSEFAALNQYIFIFGKAMKLEELEVEDFEQESIKPTPSIKLPELGLALLKNISSHRGLTLDIFDEYTRRQYVAKAPERNPFGDEEEPKKFNDFDIFTKIRVLHQLTIWTFFNPDRVRDKFGEANADEQTSWRMEPFGWDSDDRIYFLLDDDRLYRQTEAPPPKPVQKKKAKPRRGSRASKRRRVSRVVESTPEDEADADDGANDEEEAGEDTVFHGLEYEENFEGQTWECICVSLEDYRNFMDGIKKSRDQNERNLYKRLESDIIPHLLQREEERQRKAARRQRELENLEKLATAKRSSRLASKQELKRQEEEAQEVERKRREELIMARKEEARAQKMEEERKSRMMTREQRLKDREVKRILQEEKLREEEAQLAKLAEEEANGGPSGRASQRHLKAEMERRQRELEALQTEEEEWIFDCAVCGVYGANLDDGTHSIACEKCNVWQHSACHGIGKEEAENDDFHFICKDCKYKMENPVPEVKVASVEVQPKDEKIQNEHPQAQVESPVQTKIKTQSPKVSKKPGEKRVKYVKPTKDGVEKTPRKSKVSATTPGGQQTPSSRVSQGSFSLLNGPNLSPHGQHPGPPGTAVFGGASITPVEFRPTTQSGQSATNGQAYQQSPLQWQQTGGSPTRQPQQSNTNGHHSQPRNSSQSSTLPGLNGSQQSFGLFPQPQPSPVNGSSPVKSSHPPSTPAPVSAQTPQTTYQLPRPPQYPSTTTPLHSSPPPPVHQTPRPKYNASLDASQSALQGSSPGYSPTKHSSPPRQSPTQSSFGKENPLVPPIALSPAQPPNFRGAPVKNASPPLPTVASPITSFSSVQGAPALTTTSNEQSILGNGQ